MISLLIKTLLYFATLFIYLRYNKNNTHESLYCKTCKSGFLTARRKINHNCKRRRCVLGRFRCRSCAYETESRKDIKKHVNLCGIIKTKSLDLVERVMNTKNTNLIDLCPLCGKGFSPHNNYKDKHISECLQNLNRQKVQTRQWECRICGKCYVLKTAAVQHFQTCHQTIKGGNPRHKKFRYFTEKVNLNFKSLYLATVSNKIISATLESVQAKCKEDSLKAYPIFQFIVGKDVGTNKENIWSMYFNVEIAVIHPANYRNIVRNWVRTAITLFEESKSLGSGYEFIELESVSIIYFQFKSETGRGGGKALPTRFYNAYKIVNIINSPKDGTNCFHACIVAALWISKKRENGNFPFVRATTMKLRKTAGGALIDYAKLDMSLFSKIKKFLPMKLSNIGKAEKYIAPYTLNVYTLADKGSRLQPYYISKSHNKDLDMTLIINLLYHAEHYYLINKLDSLIDTIKGKRRFHRTYCFNCMHSFDTRITNLQEHLKGCLLGIKSQISYAPDGTTKDFSRFEMTIKKAYFIFCDFECTLLEVPNDEKDAGDKTVKHRRHSINSCCYVLYVEENLHDFPYEKIESYRYYYDEVNDDTETERERLIYRFIARLKTIAEIIMKWLNSLDTEKQLVELKKLHFQEYNECKTCVFCTKRFDEPTTTRKVFHHDHMRCKFISASCSDCNLKARKTKPIDVLFHNLSYDINFILENLDFEVFGSDEVWKCSMRGQKLQVMCSNLLRFRDSYSLLPLSLEKLASKLKPEDCKYQTKYLPFASPGKDIFPYSYLTSVHKFAETRFPSYDNFKNDMGSQLCPKVYAESLAFYNENFKCLGEWNKYYITKDVMCGVDVLIANRDYIYDLTGLDLLTAFSLPDLALNALLKFLIGRESLKVITNPDMYQHFLEGCKGGLSWAALRHSRIEENRRGIDHILYWDLKSSYAHAWSYPMCVGEWEYIPMNTPQELTNLVSSMDVTSEGLLVKIDVFTPRHVSDYLGDLPLTYEKTSFPSSWYPDREAYKSAHMTNKLIGHVGKAIEYVCSMEELIIMLQFQLVITRVHSVIKYRKRAFAASFIDLLSKERQKAVNSDNEVVSSIIKAVLTSLFGKTILNKLRYMQTNVVSTADHLEKKVKNHRFMRATIQKYSAITVSHQKKVVLDSLVHIGCGILSISKCVLISYFYMIKKYIESITYILPKPRFRGMYFDTDSMLVSITNVPHQELCRILKENFSHIFDWSNLPVSHPLFSTENQFKIGLLKFETEGLDIQETNALGPKCYNVSFFPGQIDKDGKPVLDINKAKGVPTYVSKQFTRKDYRESNVHTTDIFKNVNISLSSDIMYFSVEADMRRTYTKKVKKRVLNPFDSKRYLICGGLDSLPLGSFRIKELNAHNQ